MLLPRDYAYACFSKDAALVEWQDIIQIFGDRDQHEFKLLYQEGLKKAKTVVLAPGEATV